MAAAWIPIAPSRWAEREQRALQRGYAGARVTGNAFWLESSWQSFADYEARLDEQFLSAASHELKTPPMATQLYIDSLVEAVQAGRLSEEERPFSSSTTTTTSGRCSPRCWTRPAFAW